jgi:hypothetical protein
VISVSPRARRGGSCPGRRPVTQGAHHQATPVCTAPPGPGYCSCRRLLSHHGHRGRATASPALYHAPASKSHFLPQHPVRAHPHLARPSASSGPNVRTERPRPPPYCPPAPPRANPERQPRTPTPNANQARPKHKPSATTTFAANLFLQPATSLSITVSCQPREQARSVSRVFRVRCHIVTC